MGKLKVMKYKTDIGYRKQTLIRLLDSVRKHEKDVIEALSLDFGKPSFETVATETAYVIADLKHTIRNINKWAKPKKVRPALVNFPSSDFIYPEPYGTVLVIAPWNYPFQLAICPVIAAVAAGNQVVLKPSELTSNTASIIELIISEAFDPVHVEVYQGGPEVSQRLLSRRWDYIFFTGSLNVGRVVAEAAAKNLTPITLELGGKNPCIVDSSANLKIAARRIVWGKFINAGQTCIAPDFVLVHSSQKDRLVKSLKDEIILAYGSEPASSPDYARIINDGHMQRLTEMIDPQKVVYGGKFDFATRYISPTLIVDPAQESKLMAEEIFGPILPVISYSDETEIERQLSKYEKPLALYVFSEDKRFSGKIIRRYAFGGGCVNDTVVHFANKRLPFGGVGHSGMGAYHGKFGFDTFSHKKSVVKRATWLDITLRYAPYRSKLQKLRKLFDWIY